MVVQRASTERAAILRSKAFSLANSCSIRLRHVLAKAGIGRVRRQVAQFRACGLDGFAHTPDLMARQIVENDDVTGLQGRCQHLLDIGEEARTVDGAIENRRCGQAVSSEGADEGGRLPDGRAAPMRPGACRASSGRSGASYSSWPKACPREGGDFVDEDEMVHAQAAPGFSRHASRAAATSARSCSAAWHVFFYATSRAPAVWPSVAPVSATAFVRSSTSG